MILAEIDPGNILTIGAGAITALGIAAAAVISAFRKGVNRGRTEREVHVAGQPVGVRLHDAFVTRTEMLEFKAEIKADVKEMRGSYERLLMLIDERDKKLSEMIERVAAGAFEGRRRIHDELNAQGKKLEAIGVNTDVSKNIGKLGAALMTHLKTCPVANPTKG